MTSIEAHSGGRLTVPGDFLTSAQFQRVGDDLRLTGGDGRVVLVHKYFGTDTPPDLVSSSGAVINAHLATQLAGPLAPGQYAQLGPGDALGEAIGKVGIADGTVKVTHADGTQGVLHRGDAIHQGDVIQTEAGGHVGITFEDNSTFSLGERGRMVMDQMVYDPSAHSGSGQVDVTQGGFAFVSGDLSKAHPDSFEIKTPVATIGIRGTGGGGRVLDNGATEIALIAEADGFVGELSITTEGGSVVLNQPSTASWVTSASAPPGQAFAVSDSQFAQILGDALTALPNASQSLPAGIIHEGQQLQQQQQQPNDQHSSLTPLQREQALQQASGLAKAAASVAQLTAEADSQFVSEQIQLGTLVGWWTTFFQGQANEEALLTAKAVAAANAAELLAEADLTQAQADQADVTHIACGQIQYFLTADPSAAETAFYNQAQADAAAALALKTEVDAAYVTAAQMAVGHSGAYSAVTAAQVEAQLVDAAYVQAAALVQDISILYGDTPANLAAAEQQALVSWTGGTIELELSKATSEVTADQAQLANDIAASDHAASTLTELRGQYTNVLIADEIAHATYGVYQPAVAAAQVVDANATVALEAWQSLVDPTSLPQSVAQPAHTLTEIDADIVAAVSASGAARVADIAAAQVAADSVLAHSLSGFQAAYLAAYQAANGGLSPASIPAPNASSTLYPLIASDAATHSWSVAWQVASNVDQAVAALVSDGTYGNVQTYAAEIIVDNNLTGAQSLETSYIGYKTAEDTALAGLVAIETQAQATFTADDATLATLQGLLDTAQAAADAARLVVTGDLTTLTADELNLSAVQWYASLAEAVAVNHAGTDMNSAVSAAQAAATVAQNAAGSAAATSNYGVGHTPLDAATAAADATAAATAAYNDYTAAYAANGNAIPTLAQLPNVAADLAVATHDQALVEGAGGLLATAETALANAQTALTNANAAHAWAVQYNVYDATTAFGQSLDAGVASATKAVADAEQAVTAIEQSAKIIDAAVTLVTDVDPLALATVQAAQGGLGTQVTAGDATALIAAQSQASQQAAAASSSDQQAQSLLAQAASADSLFGGSVHADWSAAQVAAAAAHTDAINAANYGNLAAQATTAAAAAADVLAATTWAGQAASQEAIVATASGQAINDAAAAGLAIVQAAHAQVATDLSQIGGLMAVATDLSAVKAAYAVMVADAQPGAGTVATLTADQVALAHAIAVFDAAAGNIQTVETGGTITPAFTGGTSNPADVASALVDATTQVAAAEAAITNLGKLGTGAAAVTEQAAQALNGLDSGSTVLDPGMLNELNTLNVDAKLVAEDNALVQDYGAAGQALISAFTQYASTQVTATTAANAAAAATQTAINNEQASMASADATQATLAQGYEVLAIAQAQAAAGDLSLANTALSNHDYQAVAQYDAAADAAAAAARADFNLAADAAHYSYTEQYVNAGEVIQRVSVPAIQWVTLAGNQMNAAAISAGSADGDAAASSSDAWRYGILTAQRISADSAYGTAGNLESQARATYSQAATAMVQAQSNDQAPLVAQAAAAAALAVQDQGREAALSTYLASYGSANQAQALETTLHDYALAGGVSLGLDPAVLTLDQVHQALTNTASPYYSQIQGEISAAATYAAAHGGSAVAVDLTALNAANALSSTIAGYFANTSLGTVDADVANTGSTLSAEIVAANAYAGGSGVGAVVVGAWEAGYTAALASYNGATSANTQAVNAATAANNAVTSASSALAAAATAYTGAESNLASAAQAAAAAETSELLGEQNASAAVTTAMNTAMANVASALASVTADAVAVTNAVNLGAAQTADTSAATAASSADSALAIAYSVKVLADAIPAQAVTDANNAPGSSVSKAVADAQSVAASIDAQYVQAVAEDQQAQQQKLIADANLAQVQNALDQAASVAAQAAAQNATTLIAAQHAADSASANATSALSASDTNAHAALVAANSIANGVQVRAALDSAVSGADTTLASLLVSLGASVPAGSAAATAIAAATAAIHTAQTAADSAQSTADGDYTTASAAASDAASQTTTAATAASAASSDDSAANATSDFATAQADALNAALEAKTASTAESAAATDASNAAAAANAVSNLQQVIGADVAQAAALVAAAQVQIALVAAQTTAQTQYANASNAVTAASSDYAGAVTTAHGEATNFTALQSVYATWHGNSAAQALDPQAYNQLVGAYQAGLSGDQVIHGGGSVASGGAVAQGQLYLNGGTGVTGAVVALGTAQSAEQATLADTTVAAANTDATATTQAAGIAEGNAAVVESSVSSIAANAGTVASSLTTAQQAAANIGLVVNHLSPDSTGAASAASGAQAQLTAIQTLAAEATQAANQAAQDAVNPTVALSTVQADMQAAQHYAAQADADLAAIKNAPAQTGYYYTASAYAADATTQLAQVSGADATASQLAANATAAVTAISASYASAQNVAALADSASAQAQTTYGQASLGAVPAYLQAISNSNAAITPLVGVANPASVDATNQQTAAGATLAASGAALTTLQSSIAAWQSANGGALTTLLGQIAAFNSTAAAGQQISVPSGLSTALATLTSQATSLAGSATTTLNAINTAATAAGNDHAAVLQDSTSAQALLAGAQATTDIPTLTSDLAAVTALATDAQFKANDAVAQDGLAQTLATSTTNIATNATALSSAFSSFQAQVTQLQTLYNTQAASQLQTAAVVSAVADSGTVAENGSVTLNILANDHLANGTVVSTLSASAVSVVVATGASGPQHGAAVFNTSTGQLVYTPWALFNGTDSFSYTVTTSAVINGTTVYSSSSATVSVAVTPVTVGATISAPSSVSGSEDAPVSIALSVTDANPNETIQSVTLSGAPAGSTLVVGGTTITQGANNVFTLTAAQAAAGTVLLSTPTGTVGSYSLTATAIAQAGSAAQVTHADSFTVTQTDLSPTMSTTLAVTDTIDHALTNAVGAVAATGNTLSYAVGTTAAAHGVVSFNQSAGTFTYTPTNGYAGSDQFQVVVTDNHGGSAVETVSVTVNDTAPITSALAVTDVTNQSVTAAVGATTAVGNTLGYALGTTAPAHGTVSFDQTGGTFTYAPTTGYAGTDQFTVVVTDNHGQASTETVSVTVIGVPSSVDSGVTFTLAAALVSGHTITGLGTVAISDSVITANADLHNITANLTLVSGVSVANGVTLTLSAAEATGQTIGGGGTISVVGLTAGTDLTHIAAGDAVTATVTGGTVDLTADATLGHLGAISVAAGATLIVTAAEAATLSTSGAGSVEIAGAVIDGPVAGATVYRTNVGYNPTGHSQTDIAANSQAHTTSSATGQFALAGSGGEIVSFGGTDVTTGTVLPVTLALTAPAGSGAVMVTPITTLVATIANALAGSGTPSAAQILAAVTQVQSALGLSASTNLLSAAPSGAVETANAALGSVITQSATQLVNAGADATAALTQVVSALAASSGTSGALTTANLSSPTTIVSVLNTAAAGIGGAVQTSVASNATTFANQIAAQASNAAYQNSGGTTTYVLTDAGVVAANLAAIAANFQAAGISPVVFGLTSGSGTVSLAQLSAARTALGGGTITFNVASGTPAITISDTATNLGAALSTIHGTAVQLAVTSGTLAVGAAQLTDSVTGAAYDVTSGAIAVTDSAANAGAHLAGVLANAARVTSLTLTDASAATLSYTVSGGDGANLTSLLGKVTANTHVTLALSGTASALEADYAAGLTGLASLSGFAAVTVTASAVGAADVATLLTDFGAILQTVSVSDTTANVQANFTSLLSNTAHIGGITLSDSSAATLAYSVTGGDGAALHSLLGTLAANSHVTLALSGSAANLEADYTAGLTGLASLSGFAGVTVTASAVGAADVATLATDFGSTLHTVTVSDTTANVQANLTSLLSNVAHIGGVTLSDSSAATLAYSLTGGDGANLASLLGKLAVNTHVTLALSGSAAHLEADYAAGLTGTMLSTLVLGGKVAAVTVTASAVGAADVATLAADFGSLTQNVTVSDTTANVQAHFADLITYAGHITSLTLTDSSAATLTYAVSGTDGANLHLLLGKLVPNSNVTLALTGSAGHLESDYTSGLTGVAAMSGFHAVSVTATSAAPSDVATLMADGVGIIDLTSNSGSATLGGGTGSFTITASVGNETIKLPASAQGNATLNLSGGGNHLNVAAVPDWGFLGASTEGGSNLVLTLTAAVGGGTVVIDNQFSGIAGDGIASISTGSGKSTLVIGGNLTSNGTLAASSGTDTMVVGDQGEATLIAGGGGHDTFFPGGGNQVIIGNSALNSSGGQMIGGKVDYQEFSAALTLQAVTPVSDASDATLYSGFHGQELRAIGSSTGPFVSLWETVSGGNVALVGQEADAFDNAIGGNVTLISTSAQEITTTGLSGVGFAAAWYDGSHLVWEAWNTTGSGITSDVGPITIDGASGVSVIGGSGLTGLYGGGGNAAATAIAAAWVNGGVATIETFQLSNTATTTTFQLNPGNEVVSGSPLLVGLRDTTGSFEGDFVGLWTVGSGTHSGDLDGEVFTTTGQAASSVEFELGSGLGVSSYRASALQGTGFAVSWIQGAGQNHNLYTEAFNSDGTARGSYIIALGAAVVSDWNQVRLSNGDYLVVWGTGSGANATINVQEISSQGYSQGPMLHLAVPGMVSFDANTEGGSTPGFVLEWSDGSGNVLFQHYDCAGNPVETVSVGGNTDTLFAINQVVGGSGDDHLTGGANQTLTGGAGNNTLTGTAGGDTAISYEIAPAGVTVNLATGTASNGFGGTDTLSNIATVVGSSFADTLTGGNTAGVGYTLDGGGGNDTLIGGSANTEFVIDPTATVTVTGGAGYNILAFDELAATYNFISGGSTIHGISEIDLYDSAGVTLITLDAAIIHTISSADYLQISGGPGVAVNVTDGGWYELPISLYNGDHLYLNSTVVLDVQSQLSVNFSTQPTVSTEVSYTAGANSSSATATSHYDVIDLGNYTPIGASVDGSNDLVLQFIGGKSLTLTGEMGAGDRFAFLHTNLGAGLLELTAENTSAGPAGNYLLVAGANHAVTGGGGSDWLFADGGGTHTLTGGSGSEMLVGSATGSDTLIAGSGIDTLMAGGGLDTLEGGAGSDLFVVNAGTSTLANTDVITNFTSLDTLFPQYAPGLGYVASAYAFYFDVDHTVSQNVATTVSNIESDATIGVGRMVFFTDGTNGWLYVKAATTPADGTLIELAGVTTAPSLSQLSSVSAVATITDTVGSPGSVGHGGSVTAAFSAVDGNSAYQAGVITTATAAHGTVSVDSHTNGYTYTYHETDPSFTGTADTISFTSSDGHGGITTTTATVTIAAGSDVTLGGTESTYVLSANSSDQLSVYSGASAVESNLAGPVTVHFADHTVSYNSGVLTASGSGSQTLNVGDGTGISSVNASATTGTVTIDISADTNGVTVTGGSGNDTFTLDPLVANSTIFGGSGVNTVRWYNPDVSGAGLHTYDFTDIVPGLPSNQTFSNIDTVTLGGGVNTIILDESAALAMAHGGALTINGSGVVEIDTRDSVDGDIANWGITFNHGSNVEIGQVDQFTSPPPDLGTHWGGTSGAGPGTYDFVEIGGQTIFHGAGTDWIQGFAIGLDGWGGELGVDGGSTLHVTGDAVNEGGKIDVTNATLDIGGSLTNNGEFTLTGGSANAAADVGGSLTNSGTLNIEADWWYFTVEFDVGGSLTNSGSIGVSAASANAILDVSGSLTNSGTLTINGFCEGAATGWDAGAAEVEVGGDLTNSQAGTIVVAAGWTYPGYMYGVAKLAITGGLTNDGEITVEAGPISDSPIVPCDSYNTAIVDVGGSLTNGAAGTIALTAGTSHSVVALDVTGNVTNSGIIALFGGSTSSPVTLTVGGDLTNDGTITLTSPTYHCFVLTVGGDIINDGTIALAGGCDTSPVTVTVGGGLTNDAAGIITLSGGYTNSPVTLTVVGNLTNDGTISLAGGGGDTLAYPQGGTSSPVTLHVSGNLTNDGTIDLTGASGHNTLSGDVNAPVTLYVGGELSNDDTIAVMAVGGADPFIVAPIVDNAEAGVIDDYGVLTVERHADGTGAVVVTNEGIIAVGNSSATSAALMTVDGSLTNDGSITLSGGYAGATAALDVTGTLTNDGAIDLWGSLFATATLEVGGGLISSGFINVSGGGANILQTPLLINTGAIFIAGDYTSLAVAPTSGLSVFDNTEQGTLTGYGTLDLTGMVASSEGTIATEDEVFTVTGNLSLGATSQLAVVIDDDAGISLGLAVTGNLSLDGTLDVAASGDLSNGPYTVVSVTGVLSGGFTAMIGMADYAGGSWVLDPHYSGGSLTLTVEAPTEPCTFNGSYYVATGQYLVALPDHSCSLDGNGSDGDVLIGQNGNDTFSIDRTSFDLIDGGGGQNVLVWENNNGGPVHLTSGGGLIENIQQIELAYSGTNLFLSAADVATINGGAPLTITAVGTDSVTLVGAWQAEAGPSGYEAYVSGGATVDIATNLSVATVLAPQLDVANTDPTAAQVNVAAVSTEVDTLTVEMSVTWSGLPEASTAQYIFYNGNYAGTGYGLFISNSGEIYLDFEGINRYDTHQALTAGAVTDLVLQRDGGAWELSLNGGLSFTDVGTSVTPNAVTGDTTLGNVVDNNTMTDFGFLGTVIDAAFWNSVRDSADIASDFNTLGSGGSLADAAGAWEFGPSAVSTYSFSDLTTGSIDGQDGWAVNGSGYFDSGLDTIGTSTIAGYNDGITTFVPGSELDAGAEIARLGGGALQMPTLTPNEVVTLQYDFVPNYWGSSLQIGSGASAGDLFAAGGAEAGAKYVTYDGTVSLIDAEGNVTNGSLALTSGTNWYSFKVIFNLAADGGHGDMSLYYRDDTAGGNWIAVAGLQDIALNADWSAVGAANPADWNGVMFRADNGESLLANVSYSVMALATVPGQVAATVIASGTSNGAVFAVTGSSDPIQYALDMGAPTNNGDGTYTVATAHGSVTLTTDTGFYTYTAGAYYGLDSFDWIATDTTTGLQSVLQTTILVSVNAVDSFSSNFAASSFVGSPHDEIVVSGCTFDIDAAMTAVYADIQSGALLLVASGHELTLTAGGVIEAGGALNLDGGTLDVVSGTMQVAGTLDLDGGIAVGGELVVTGAIAGGSLVLDGTLDLNCVGATLSGATLTGTGTLINDGVLTLAGTDTIAPVLINHAGASLDINGATVTCSAVDNLGALVGHGTLDGEVYSNGTLTPSGTLSIDGGLAFGDNSVVTLSGGTSHTELNVTGDVALGGTLDITFSTDSHTSAGDYFTAIAATGSVTGAFTALEGLIGSYEANTWLLDPSLSGSNLQFTVRDASEADGLNGYAVAGQDLLGYLNHASTLDGSGYSHDVLIGQGGDDTLIIGSTAFDFLDGGAGTNTLELSAGGVSTYDFTAKQGLMQNIQLIDPTHAANNTTIDLNAANIMNMSQGANTLATGALGTGYGNSVLIGGTGSATGEQVNLEGTGWGVDVAHSTATIGGESYSVYSNGNVHALIDVTHITVHYSVS